MPSVLIVESDEPLVRLMAWFLLEAGFEVTAVKRAEDAEERLGGYAPDVIVLNTPMPDEQKVTLIRAWRAITPTVSVLDVSYSRVSTEDVAAVGADTHLAMPFHADELVECVRSLIEKAGGGPPGD